MDGPNAPNPANPNEQDQNGDAAQGPTIKHKVQQNRIRLRSLQLKFQSKFLQLKFQFRVLHRLVKIYLFNHYNNQFPCNQPLLV